MEPRFLFDTHSHAHDDLAHLDDIPELDVDKVALMGTSQNDWGVVERLHRAKPDKVLAAFGVHPYFAHRLAEGWLEELREKLVANPRAIVGEIGLDKAAITPDTARNEYDAQTTAFTAQFDLAVELQRPISFHCVRAFGHVMTLFRQHALRYDQLMRSGEEDKARGTLPPAIIMHSFAGTVGGMESLLSNKGRKGNIQERLYFSFSKIVNMRAPKTIDVIKAVPEDRLLIESDQHSPAHGEEDLRRICEIIAEARGWSVEQTARITHANATRVFSFIA